MDKILATITLACLIGFLSFLIFFVREVDLTMVILIVVAMAVYSFVTDIKGEPED